MGGGRGLQRTRQRRGIRPTRGVKSGTPQSPAGRLRFGRGAPEHCGCRTTGHRCGIRAGEQQRRTNAAFFIIRYFFVFLLALSRRAPGLSREKESKLNTRRATCRTRKTKPKAEREKHLFLYKLVQFTPSHIVINGYNYQLVFHPRTPEVY